MLKLPEIIQLDDGRASNAKIVGGKAADLARLASETSVPIPRGFCIPTDVVWALRIGTRPIQTVTGLAAAIAALLKQSGTHELIVRSSAYEEGTGYFRFPGILSSFRDIRDSDQCFKAVLHCVSALSSPRVSEYCHRLGLDPGNIRLAVLVQEQIRAAYAGAARLDDNVAAKQVSIELVEGSSLEYLNGANPSVHWQIDLLSRDSHSGVAKLSRLENSLRAVLVQLFAKRHLDLGQIEWVFDGRSTWVVQASARSPFIPESRRVLDSQVSPTALPAAPKRAQLIPGEERIGLKGSAMKYFVARAWFRRNVFFLEPLGALDEFESELKTADWHGMPITVRFSYRDEIGLPRGFFTRADSAAEFVRRNWKRRWLAIAHEYLNVERSFELLVGSDYFVLEHVPGVWESDSQVLPDVVADYADRTVLLAVRGSREKRRMLPDHSEERTSEPPVAMNVLHGWRREAEVRATELRKDFEVGLPILVHFVEDDDGEWQFLNLRRTGPVERPRTKPNRFHVIRSEKDLESWDRESPLLLQVSVPRGSEHSLTYLASVVPRSSEIWVDFGSLSHPAMVLRELGYKVIPAYRDHDRLEIAK